jgi:pyrroline-5-carboxylate reductase
MKITIVGCGNMGLMFAHALLKYNIVSKENLFLVEKNEQRQQDLMKLNIGNVATTSDSKIGNSDIFILAVKPQDFEKVAAEIKPVLQSAKCIISIMAGVKINRMESLLGNPNIVRAMPNSPAELGMGMTGFTASKALSVEQVHKAENLLATTGRTVFFEDEDLIDSCTAISGSGPAYFFYIVKNMIDAGVKLGLDEATSAILVKQTMLGSFHLMNSTDKSLDELIKAVTSKGGTTEAALTSFSETHVGDNIQKGLERARDRARELSK